MGRLPRVGQAAGRGSTPGGTRRQVRGWEDTQEPLGGATHFPTDLMTTTSEPDRPHC